MDSNLLVGSMRHDRFVNTGETGVHVHNQLKPSGMRQSKNDVRLANQLWEASANAVSQLKFVLKYETDPGKLIRLAEDLRNIANAIDRGATSLLGDSCDK